MLSKLAWNKEVVTSLQITPIKPVPVSTPKPLKTTPKPLKTTPKPIKATPKAVAKATPKPKKVVETPPSILTSSKRSRIVQNFNEDDKEWCQYSAVAIEFKGCQFDFVDSLTA